MAEDTILDKEPVSCHAGTKSPATFTSLSQELKDSIISYIIRPTDLQNVCLVSHELHKIAVRYLYREICLDLGSENDHKLAPLLRPHNIGLQHVRHVKLSLADYDDHCVGKEGQAQFAVQMLLEFLPEDTLETFSWHPWRPFNAENLLLLYRKQRRLQWLEVMNTSRDILPDLEKDEQLQSTLFGHATRLALYPDDATSLTRSGYFVKKMAQQLQSLLIHADFGTTHEHVGTTPTIDPGELNDSATGPGLLTRTLFGHLEPFDQCTPFAHLVTLTLNNVSLRYAADTWCKFVNFQQLECLHLHSCPGVDSLLGQLCKSSHLPKNLRRLSLEHRDNSDNETRLALNDFLCLVQGIQELFIDLQRVTSLPSTAGICRQGKTLVLLSVHASNESNSFIPLGRRSSICTADELFWSSDDINTICSACQQIEQLSCAWPTTDILKEPSEACGLYRVAIVKHLKKLVTLHVTTWPNTTNNMLLPRSVYEALIQWLACLLFKEVRGRENEEPVVPIALRLVAFGISDKVDDREDSKNQLIYLRSTAKDAVGKDIVHAVKIDWCLRQYVEPRSDILNFPLARKARLPVRRDDFDSDSDDDV